LISLLPKTVKVGPYVYKIEKWDAMAARDADKHGECDTAMHIIRVDATYSEAAVKNTLLHEILHAVWNAWGLGDSEEEEKAVNNMANGLQAVLNDNPGLIKFLI